MLSNRPNAAPRRRRSTRPRPANLVAVGLRVLPRERDRLSAIAQQQEVTVGELVRVLVRERLAQMDYA